MADLAGAIRERLDRAGDEPHAFADPVITAIDVVIGLHPTIQTGAGATLPALHAHVAPTAPGIAEGSQL